MHIHIYTVNAFSKNISGGNPACVVPLEKWIDDEIMLEIAKENAVTETAFFIQNGD